MPGLWAIRNEKQEPTMSMMAVPTAMAISVPAGPATGRKVVPGMTKAPQPTMQPKAIAQTSTRDRYLSSALFALFVSIFSAPPEKRLMPDLMPRPCVRFARARRI